MSRKTNMLLVLGGAATAGAAAYLAFRRSTKTTEDVQKAIDMGLKEGMASTLERLDELLEAMPAPVV